MTTRYFGMDVHKDYVVATAADASGGEIVNPVRVEMPKLKQWIDKHLTADDEVALYPFRGMTNREGRVQATV